MDLNLENVRQVLINTGNILSLNDITKKPTQNPTEELIEAINLTIKEYQNGSKCETSNNVEHEQVISRSNDDFANKMADQADINDLKIGLKIFLNSDNPDFLREALEKAFDLLNVSNVQNVVLAIKQKQAENSSDQTEHIKKVWKTVEEYSGNKKIQQIGLADVEEATFREIYHWATVKPSIIQINLATCCVVPPTLQAFCKDNDILLLTHSDSADVLPKASIENILQQPFVLNWVLRYLVHIKCRGVLIAKGYLISINK